MTPNLVFDKLLQEEDAAFAPLMYSKVRPPMRWNSLRHVITKFHKVYACQSIKSHDLTVHLDLYSLCIRGLSF